MGGDHRQHRPLGERLGGRARQRRPLVRVGAGHQLVEQHQRRARDGGVQDLGHVRQVPRERRQISQDRLPIADVGPDRVEEADATAGRRRDQEPGPRHQRREPDRLHEHRLAPCVRAAHDQDSRRVAAERDVVGHDGAGCTGRGMRERQQGMACGFQVDDRRLDDRDRRPAVGNPQPRGRRQRVERRQRASALAQGRRHHRHVGGERLENSPRLVPDVELDDLQPVVGRHQRRRLDEHRLSRPRRVVDDPEAERLRGGLERQHEPLRTHREELVLQDGDVLLRPHELLDRAAGVLGQPLALLAQPGQLRRSGVADLPRSVERRPDGPRQPARRIELRCQRRDLRRRRPRPADAGRPDERPPRPLGDFRQYRDRTELVGPEHDAPSPPRRVPPRLPAPPATGATRPSAATQPPPPPRPFAAWPRWRCPPAKGRDRAPAPQPTALRQPDV